VELKEKIQQSLAGRKRVFLLTTLTLEEFFHYRTDYRYEGTVLDFFSLEKRKSREILDEYLTFGGYPRVVLEEEFSQKKGEINEIYQSYIERDIAYLLRVHKIDEFSRLIKILAKYTGKLINFSTLSRTIGVSEKTIKDYLWYLEKTFILYKVPPFFTNFRKEITRTPLYYFYDPGMRNFACGEFGIVKEYGFLFQNCVYTLLQEKLKNIPYKIHFWRTKDGAEVDFVITMGEKIIPVEVKYEELKSPEITRSMRSFIERYKPRRGFLINLSLHDRVKINNSEIMIIPYYLLLKNFERTILEE